MGPKIQMQIMNRGLYHAAWGARAVGGAYYQVLTCTTGPDCYDVERFNPWGTFIYGLVACLNRTNLSLADTYATPCHDWYE